MVDYNIGIPQQQLFQAPDVMQNAMRMQQMQMQEMQTQELARRRGEEAALRGITADPNSPEYVKRAMLVSPEFGLKAIAMQRQNTAADRAADASTRQAQEATVRMANIRQTMGRANYDNAQNTLAIVPPGDAASYAKWYGQFRSAFSGMNLPTPEQWAQDTNGRLKGHMLATAESARALMTPKAPVYIKGPGDTNLRVDPDNPDLLRETNILEAGAPQPGAGAGRVDTYRDPNLAARQDTQRRLGLPVTVDDGGLAARADTGAPVNALAAGQRQQPAVVGNAMAAPVAPPSPYGALVQPQAARAPAVVGSGEFARRVELQKAAEKIAAAENEAYARTQGTSRATAEATAKEKLPELTNTIKELEDAMKPGGLIEQSTASPAGRARDAAGRLINVSTTGSEAIAKLQPLRARLLMSMPRLEGPQGVLDLELYNQASGDMANPEKSTGDRMAAAETVLRLIKANRAQFEAQVPKGQRPPVTDGAKRVSNKTEYDALPAGSVYIDPNGEQRTKR